VRFDAESTKLPSHHAQASSRFNRAGRFLPRPTLAFQKNYHHDNFFFNAEGMCLPWRLPRKIKSKRRTLVAELEVKILGVVGKFR